MSSQICLVDFRAAAGERATADLLGLPVVVRAALTAKKIGFAEVIVVVAAPRLAAVKALVAADRRLGDVSVLDRDPGCPRAQERVVVSGDAIFADDLWRAARAPLGDAAARLWVEGEASIGLRRERESSEIDDATIEHLEVAARSWAPLTRGRAAEAVLLGQLVKSADGVISRHINRKISTRISRWLAPTRVSPNHVTLVVLLIGVATFPLASLGTYLGFALGGLAYYIAAVIDGVDGELARLKFAGSGLGSWLDTIVDDIVGLAWLAGVFVGLDRAAAHAAWEVVGIATVVLYLVMLAPRYVILATTSGAGNHQRLATKTSESSRFERAYAAVRDVIFRCDFLPFYAMVTATLGLASVFAVTYAAGIVLGVFDTVWLWVRHRRGLGGELPASG